MQPRKCNHTAVARPDAALRELEIQLCKLWSELEQVAAAAGKGWLIPRKFSKIHRVNKARKENKAEIPTSHENSSV